MIYSHFGFYEARLTAVTQLVVTGDFFQLPPVTPSGKEVCFAFQSLAWKESIGKTVTLTQVFRQKDDRKCTPCIRGTLHIAVL